jgi:predicted hydrocarbon binding protein
LSLLTITKLMAMKELEMKNGTIVLFGKSAIFLPAERLIRLHEMIENDAGTESADRILFEMGREQTRDGSQKYYERKKEFATMMSRVSKTGDPAVEMGSEVFRFIGMGDTKIQEIKKDFSRIIVTTGHSPFAVEYLKTRGKSKRPVCHYMKGLFLGVIEGAGKTGYKAKEIACASTGISKECIFEFTRITPQEQS